MNLKEVILISILFIFLTMLFFYKIFFGLIPLPADLIVGAYHPWLNYNWNYAPSVPIHNPIISDPVSITYPLKTLAIDFLKKGHLPLWNPYMFGGYPLYASIQLGLLFPTMVFYLLFSPPLAWTFQIMIQPILASIFMYLLLRHFGLDKLPSLFGGIAYGFGGFALIWMEWNVVSSTSMFLPILVLFEDKYLISKKTKWGILFSIFFCLQILAGYLPIVVFTLFVLGFFYLFRSTSFIADLKILLFLILGVSLAAIFLLPFIELIQVSQSKSEVLDFPFIWPENFINLIAPDFFGNPVTGNFWGKGLYLDSTLYTGITVLIFSLIGLMHCFSKTYVKFAFSLLIVTIIISVANPISTFLYNLGFWGGSSIAMNRTIFIINFSLAILSAYGISLVKNHHSKLNLKPSILILSATCGIIIGLLLNKQFLLSNTNNVSNLITHINVSLRNLILPFFIISSVLATIIFTKKSAVFRSVAQFLLIVILIFELFRYGLKFNTFSSPDFIYPQTPVSEFLKQYPNDRMIAEKDLFPANMWVPFELSSITGYDRIYPLNTSQLLAVAESGNINISPMGRWGLLQNFNSKIVDTTNTRFVAAVKRDLAGQVSEDGKVNSKLMLPKYREVFSDKGVAILENTQSLPRAYLTKQVIKASDTETLKLMVSDDFPIQTISISDFEWNNNVPEVLKSTLAYEQVANSNIKIKTTSNLDAYLVVLDSFYPGWKAYIDGKETLIHRTNYNFRGILLPKGNHIVEFVYIPNSLKYGAIISGMSLVIIILLIFLNPLTNFRLILPLQNCLRRILQNHRPHPRKNRPTNSTS